MDHPDGPRADWIMTEYRRRRTTCIRRVIVSAALVLGGGIVAELAPEGTWLHRIAYGAAIVGFLLFVVAAIVGVRCPACGKPPVSHGVQKVNPENCPNCHVRLRPV